MEIQSIAGLHTHTHFMSRLASQPTRSFHNVYGTSKGTLISCNSHFPQWKIWSSTNPHWPKWKRVEFFTVRRLQFKGSRRPSPRSATRNGDQPAPEDDSADDKYKSDSPGTSNAGGQFILGDLDWRAFRARLVASEQVHTTENGESGSLAESSIALGPKWAHPIPVPEPGCVLLATKTLDDIPHFRRTVILLLRVGSNDHGEAPFGVILNRPLQRCIKDMKPPNPDLATIFSDCPLYFGGPLEASVFLLTTGENVITDFEEVIPGLSYGARNSLHHAAELVRNNVLQPQNFRFFLGYSAWELNQLKNEIASGYWYVAACSPNLITTANASSSGLWEEILQLMGGQYTELSKMSDEDNV